MKKNKYFLLMIVMVLTFISPRLVKANNIEFSISPLLNNRQLPDVTNYFDMTLNPNEESNVGIRIYNDDDKPHTYELSIENSFSNRNGIIDYTENDMHYIQLPALKEIATADKEISTEAHSTRDVPIKIKLPDKPFNGTILGGIRVREKDVKKEEGQIVNRYNYLIPLRIRQGEQNYPEELIFKESKVKLGNYYSDLEVVLGNNQPVMLKDMKIKITIEPKNTKQRQLVLFDKKIRMAPETVSHLLMKLNEEKLKAGPHLVTVTAKGKTFEKTWESTIEIAKKEAKQINRNIVEKKEENDTRKNWWVYLLVVLVLSQMMYILIQRRRHHDK